MGVARRRRGTFLELPVLFLTTARGRASSVTRGEWRIEKHVRTLGEIADPLRAKLGDAVSTLNLKTDPVRTKLGNAVNPLNFKTAEAPRPEAAFTAT